MLNRLNTVAKTLLVMAALLGTTYWPAPAHGAETELIVSAAMSLRSAFEKISHEFEMRNPGVRVSLNFSSSGKLRQQIEAGAPVDVFASASKRHMDILEGKGRIDSASRRNFAGNSIVLATGSMGGPQKFVGLLSTEVKRIAMGNPDTSPAGRYAKETLASLGLWEKIKGKLVFVETVRQVLDYLSRNEVDAGLLYASDAALSIGEVKVAMSAPEGSHEAIVYPIAVVTGSRSPAVARDFIEMVNSEAGRLILLKSGFRVKG